MSGCGPAPDPPLGGGISGPLLSAALPADPASTGAVVVEQRLDVELGAGQGVAGAPGRDGRDGAEGRSLYAPRGPARADLVAGQPVALVRVGIGFLPADAADFALAHVVGLAAAAAPTGAVVTVERNSLALPDWTAIVGVPDLMPARDYFLADGNGLSPAPDTVPGHCTVRVGWAADARTLVIEPSPPFLN